MWCSLHENLIPFASEVKFKFKNKDFTEKFNIHPVPTNVGTKVANTINKSKGIGIDRGNNKCLNSIDSNDKLGIMMGCSTYSCKQIKIGVEAKLLEDANVNNNAEETTTKKINFHSCADVSKEPYVKLGMKDEEVKSITEFSSENLLLVCALISCNGDTIKLSTSSSKLTWCE